MLAEWLLQIGVKEFALFVSSVMIFAMTPGIDTVFVLNRAISHGKAIGAFASLGVATGVLVHTLFAAVGLAAVVAKSALLFSVIKYLGAAYLVYLGVVSIYTALKNPQALAMNAADAANPEKIIKPIQAFYSGLLTNVLNPKVALFFLAFFPQFITPSMSTQALPYLVLGALYAVISAVWLVLLAVLAGSILAKWLVSLKAKKVMDIGSGVVFVGMGAKVALSD
ncbi:hypothetical protein B0181_03260 [Moraxella caviae]|uniref:Leucine efflux protein n=1 Tax=Moraxella caviae TaxID=34060 RepID=A0A1T0A6H4_9GAMM|nr:LysE family translocator [Moraxella caviae]OOR91335.1 hypothetical protein B0181_03260 [Moraxella caviae]STZ13945.1 Leucine efflux protein [Moraxella caviae]VEW11119.1 Leucine efflux protein [Moraxella caviae]